MSTDLIVSYDGTANDDDALALARLLSLAGATMALAYVRHSHEFDPRREELAAHDAQRRLDQGVALLADGPVGTHVIFSPSTGEGLAQLAGGEGASVIVFGSDYRTPPGHAEPGGSAQHLLEGGPVAVAVAAAGLRTNADAAIKTIAVSATDGDGAARDTAAALAGKLGATIVEIETPAVDLIVVGSQSTAKNGRIALSGASRAMLDSTRGSVLVVPNGKPVVL
ncbi:MAG: hypothetical protein ABSG43_08150 [Solirubrobacteraceae bacterium]|jgi:nucleotide-binding universal stress UspA family protein